MGRIIQARIDGYISTDTKVKCIVYQFDGSVYYIDEYDTSTEKVVKSIYYNSDGSVSSYCNYEYYSSGYKIKRYRPDGTIKSISEYVLSSDGSEDKLVNTTYYNSDGSIWGVQ